MIEGQERKEATEKFCRMWFVNNKTHRAIEQFLYGPRNDSRFEHVFFYPESRVKRVFRL